MPKKLWEPSKGLIKKSNLFAYEKFISKYYNYNFSRNYKKDEIELAIRKLKEIEIKQKTSNIDDETEFISFLYNAIG